MLIIEYKTSFLESNREGWEGLSRLGCLGGRRFVGREGQQRWSDVLGEGGVADWGEGEWWWAWKNGGGRGRRLPSGSSRGLGWVGFFKFSGWKI